MADISADLETILTEDYGENVRSAIHNGLFLMNQESKSTKEYVENSKITDIYMQFGFDTAIEPTYTDTDNRDNKFVSTQNSVGNSYDWKYSDDIAFTAGQIVLVELYAQQNIAVLAKHNSNDTYTCVKNPRPSGGTKLRRSYAIQITETGNYVVNQMKRETVTIDGVDYVNTDIAPTRVFVSTNTMLKGFTNELFDNATQSISRQFEVENDKFDKMVRGSVVDLTIINGEYINSSGSKVESSAYIRSAPFSVSAGKTVLVKTYTENYSNAVSIFAKYVDDSTYVPIAQTGGNGWELVEIPVYETGDYVISCKANKTPYVVIYDGKPVRDPVEQNIYLFSKVACIGDSQTRGMQNYIDNTASNRDLGYPNILARQTGIDFRNFGVSGCVAKTWLSTEDGYYGNYDFSSFDCAFIMLGRNWAATQSKTLEEVIADDVQYYGQIILNLKTANPNITIFCFSLPPQTSNTSAKLEIDATINTAIQTIATSYNCPYINIYHAWTLEDTKWRNGGGSSHLLPIGLTRLAKVIFDAVNEYIQVHMSDFMNIWIPDTFPRLMGDVSFLSSIEQEETS